MLFIGTMHRVVNLLIMSGAENSPNVTLKTGSVMRYRDQSVVLRVSKFQVTVELIFTPASGSGWVERFGLVRGDVVNDLLAYIYKNTHRTFSCEVDVDLIGRNQATYLHVRCTGFHLILPRLQPIELTAPELKLWRPRVWILQSINSASKLYTLDFFKTTMDLWFEDVPVNERLFLLLQYFFSNTVGVENAQYLVVNYCNVKKYQIRAAVDV